MMGRYIAFVRGINVGGVTLKMEDLKQILGYIGFSNVETYIQSGNAVFQCAEKNVVKLYKQLPAEIGAAHGFEPQVLLLTREELLKAMADNPFPDAESEENPKNLHLGFLASTPTKPNLERIDALRSGNERYHLGDTVFYLHAPDGVGRSKLAVSVERLLGVPMTDRNWNTVCKLREMVDDLEDC